MRHEVFANPRARRPGLPPWTRSALEELEELVLILLFLSKRGSFGGKAHRMRSVLISLAFLLAGFFVPTAFPQSAPAPPPEATTTPAASPFANVDRLLELGKFSEAITQLEDLQKQTTPPAGL